MVAYPGHAFAAVALAAFALTLPTAALAGSTATRCDAHGCTHIHCNATGDRCYRYDDPDGRSGRSGCAGCGETFARVGQTSRRLCDSDGDRCYVSQGRQWDYREYYRRHGYRWEK